MKQILSIYHTLWNLARPYYEKGRPTDVAHIEWMMDVAWEVSQTEHLDDSLLLPLVILHDVGYSAVAGIDKQNYYNLDIRKYHMEEGAKIAKTILTDIGYDGKKKDKIVWYVLVHDNWAYGEVDMYTNDLILGTFKDLDYLWIYTRSGCRSIQKVLKKNDVEMLEHLRAETSPIYGKKPFSTTYTKKLREQYFLEREKEIAP